MDKIASKIANNLVALEVIDRRDIAIYRYGLEVLLLSLLEIVGILFLACFIGNFCETVIYFAVFIPIRLFAGGYHALTRLKCLLISLIVYGIFTSILKFCPNHMQFEIGLFFAGLSLMVIYFLAPEIQSNRLFEHEEYLFFQKVCNRIEMINIIALMICCLLQRDDLVLIIGLGLLSETTAIFASKIISYKKRSITTLN